MSYTLTYLERRTGFVTRKVGDAYMVVPTGTRMKEYKGMITVNETGAFLFDQVKERRSAQELVDALKKEYEIDDETAFEAVSAFVDQCSFANLLVSEEVDDIDPTMEYFIPDEVAEKIFTPRNVDDPGIRPSAEPIPENVLFPEEKTAGGESDG